MPPSLQSVWRNWMKPLLKQAVFLCACLYALTGQASGDSLSDALSALEAGNNSKAVKLLRPLAKQGNAMAQFKLATLYYSGNGVRQSYKQAAHLYRQAAEQGHPVAQSNLATLYYLGEGVLKNFVLAYMWKDIATSHSEGDRQLRYLAQLKALSRNMSAKQLAEAKKLAKQCTAKKFKGCKQ